MVHTINSFIPRNQVSHIRTCFASSFPCAIADLSSYSKPSYLPVAFKPPCRSTLSLHYRLLLTTTTICHFSLVLLVDPCCRRNTTHLVHAMTCILPPSFFSQSPSFFFLALRRTIYDSLMFSTLLFMTPPLPTRCGSSLNLQPTSSSRLGNYIALPVVLERFFFRTVSYWLPCSAQLPCLAYSSPSHCPFLFFFCFSYCYLPLQPSFITIHELVTKTKQQCDDFLPFALSECQY